MPDKKGGYRLIDYGCKVGLKKDTMYEVRKIKDPDDLRPGTRKGKIDQKTVWVVRIKMPKKLMVDISEGYKKLDVNQLPNKVSAVKNKVVDQSEQDVQDLSQNA